VALAAHHRCFRHARLVAQSLIDQGVIMNTVVPSERSDKHVRATRVASSREQAPAEATKKTFGPATLSRHGSLRVLSLEGSFREMGRQHGALLADDVKVGPIPYYAGFVEKMFSRSLGALGPVALTALQRTVGARVAKGLPPFALETIEGIAEGAGIRSDEFLRGCTMPDSMLWVVSRLIQARRSEAAIAHRTINGLGCTSAIAWGSATKDGKLLHARNFDYQGVGPWPRTQTVVFMRPEKGQRYVSVAAAGVGLGGITAMNESGLTLTVHQHMFTGEAKLGGTPIGIPGDVVMREAKTLDDAERILRAHTPIGCWTYVVASAKEQSVLCFEENPRMKAPRRISRDAEIFGYANIYLDPELGRTERNLYGAYWRHNAGRHARVNGWLAAERGSITPSKMTEILADTGDPRCRVRNSIGMVLTVGSVVFRPEDGALWVGSGEAPTSRHEFMPFSLARGGHAPELGSIMPPQDAVADAAFEQYRRAYVAYVDERDTPRALAHVDRARQIAPSESVYQTVFGAMALTLGETSAAASALERSIELSHPDEERVALAHLLLGYTYDLSGKRDRALSAYERCLELRADPPVHAAATKRKKSPVTRGRVSRLDIEMSLGDVAMP
jgi:tetratricopeptide (TPR) repeat protein